MGRAFLCLALGELEEWSGPAEPVFESFRGVFEAVLQGNALGNGGSIKEENRVELIVNKGDLLARDGPGEGLLVVLAHV
jgi:hypothetical protein